MKKRILFILSGNPSTTPRAIKSISVASSFFLVDVIYINRSAIWNELDKQILNSNEINNFVSIPLGRKPFFIWLFYSFIHLICKYLSLIWEKNIYINAFASSAISFLLCRAIRNSTSNYCFIVGHSGSSLFPAYWVSRKLGIPFSFDIEDYHPGEKIEKNVDEEIARRIFLLKKLIPLTKFFTFASPLIGKNVIKLLPEDKIPGHFLVNNSFSASDFPQPVVENYENRKIRFIWFSQTISHGRGLEQLISAIQGFKDKLELTLIGNVRKEFYDQWIKPNTSYINVIAPVSQIQLHFFLSNYDIGLAIELSNSDFNRDIALSNKIFAYAQAGLYSLITNTSAQELFIRENPNFGILCEQNEASMAKSIGLILENFNEIIKNKLTRWNEAKKFAWEAESEKLVKEWKRVLEK